MTQQAGAVDVDRLEALAKAATPGEWWADCEEFTEDGHYEEPRVFGCAANDEPYLLFTAAVGHNEAANAAYAAAVNPATTLALIERLRAAEAKAATITERLEARDKYLHGRFGYVQDPSTDERKCACAYCTRDVEALGDHAAEMECELYLPSGWKSRAEKAEAELLQVRSERAKGEGWVSVEDRLPEAKGWVLAWDGEDVVLLLYAKRGFLANIGGRVITGVTHWRPLPAAPSADGSAQ